MNLRLVLLAVALTMGGSACSAQDKDAVCLVELNVAADQSEQVVAFAEGFAASEGKTLSVQRPLQAAEGYHMASFGYSGQDYEMIGQDSFEKGRFRVGFFQGRTTNQTPARQACSRFLEQARGRGFNAAFQSLE